MQERLDWIKFQPRSWVHWEPLSGGLGAHALLSRRYPQAACTLVEANPHRARHLAQAVTPPWWQAQRWLQPRPQVVTQVTQPAQMLWANMSLHMSDQPQALLQQWHQALAVDGFLMFSCLGPDTLKELRALYQALNWPAPSHEFTDMHDWGDMLIGGRLCRAGDGHGAHHPHVRVAPARVAGVAGFGAQSASAAFPGLARSPLARQLLQAIEKSAMQLTFEVVYGHAFKPAPKLAVQAQSEISLDADACRPDARQNRWRGALCHPTRPDAT